MTEQADLATDTDDALFRSFVASRSRALRNQIVERHMGLAAHIAKRFSRAGLADDDIRQVAMLGLVKAVDRFDPDHGAAFSSFAGRTIEGEIKRFFRDKSWSVKVPRGAKEMHLLVRRGSDELAHANGRAPTVPELAEHLGVDRDDVLRGLAAGAAYRVGTIDGGGTDDDSAAPPADRRGSLANDETGFDATLDRDVVAGLLELLPPRERRIVELRFYDELSQSEIAELVGISQMHVSRLLRRSFEMMRSSLADA